MFGLSGSSKKATYGVLIDVGSGSIGVAIVSSNERKKLPEILFTHRIKMRPGDTSNTADYMRRMREALFSASLILAKEGLGMLREYDKTGKISRILVTCSSPWAETISRKVTYTHDSPFKVTDNLLEELVKNAEKEMGGVVETEILGSSSNLHVVERATVHYEVNDYLVKNPIDLTGESLSLFHVTGVVPEEILDAVHEVQEKVFSETEISIHTFLLVIYCVLRDIFPERASLSIVNVTGEATEIGIIHEGVLVDSVYAPYGSNTLIREISDESKKTPEDIATDLRAYAEETSHSASTEKVETHIASYAVHLSEAIKTVTDERALPETMIITGSAQLSTFFQKIIPQIAHETTKTDFRIIDLKKHVIDEIAKDHQEDVYLAIVSGFFHKLHSCGDFEPF